MKLTQLVRIKIIYKSGAVQEVWATKFVCQYNMEKVLTNVEYHIHGDVLPVFLGVNDIAAVYQTGSKYKFFWKG